METQPKTKGEVGLRVLLHEPDDSPVLLARTHSMSAELGWSREVKLELRKFDSLSTAKDPCNDDPNYSEAKCHFDCFQRAMYEVAKCRMPYMSVEMQPSNVSECSTPGDYEDAMREVNNLLFMGEWSVHHCECEHECFETTYQAYPENMVFKPNEARLRIFYEDLVFEQIEESRAYPMISLLCDIGGTLGLLMGASVLTVCELLEVVWSHFLRGCCRLKEREPPAGKQRWQGAVTKMRDPINTNKNANIAVGLKQAVLASNQQKALQTSQHPFAAFS
ncbi:hypothetical protein B566_EDAN015030 [Ephemera danica]|nr:hypothetical protein B566_EDAN015030 [Ephemera danica]